MLPSLGDIAADLGAGPVALRGDGRRIAVAVAGGIEEVSLPSGDDPVRHEGAPSAMTFAASGELLVAAGAAVGPPGTEPSDGSAIVDLASAAGADVVAAGHEDGQVSIWEVGSGAPAPVATFEHPAGPRVLSLSADGRHLALAYPDGGPDGPPFVAVARVVDGALVRRIEGACAIALGRDGVSCAVGGEWGIAWLTSIEED